MECQYTEMAKVFKALSDPKRVKIVDLLSCGEMCACVLLKCFEITQPTLAHDMKVLTDADIVVSRRAGKNIYYSLNWEKLLRTDRAGYTAYCRRIITEYIPARLAGLGMKAGPEWQEILNDEGLIRNSWLDLRDRMARTER